MVVAIVRVVQVLEIELDMYILEYLVIDNRSLFFVQNIIFINSFSCYSSSSTKCMSTKSMVNNLNPFF
jgi:hypothetical protein